MAEKRRSGLEVFAPPAGSGPLPIESAGVCRWRIPKSARPWMRVPGLFFADERLLAQMRQDQALEPRPPVRVRVALDI